MLKAVIYETYSNWYVDAGISHVFIFRIGYYGTGVYSLGGWLSARWECGRITRLFRQSSLKRRFERQYDPTLKPMLKTDVNLIKNANKLKFKNAYEALLKPPFSAKPRFFSLE